MFGEGEQVAMDLAVRRDPITVLFIRQVRTFSGGHLKVFDYMGHLASTCWARAVLYITPDSDNILVDKWVPKGVGRGALVANADCYFVAGLDWPLLDAAGLDLSNKPVINLIQGMRHAQPDDPRYPFLSRQALRVCVSPEVSQAILATGMVKGPVETISNGVNLAELERYRHLGRTKCVFIGGLKNPELAAECAQVLSNGKICVDLCIEHLPRADFLSRMAAAEISILLPYPEEGFYLPALEAMVLGSVSVVPDCVGARSFCVDGNTCLIPNYTVRNICDYAEKLMGDSALRDHLRDGGYAMAAKHSLFSERERFLSLLQRYVSDWGLV